VACRTSTCPPLPETDQGDVEVEPHARELVVVAILADAVRDGLEDPSSTSLLRRSVRTLREMPRLSWNSSNRRRPRKASRMIRSVHRSPTSSSARAIEQF